jgi:putative ABC transport system permease protein
MSTPSRSRSVTASIALVVALGVGANVAVLSVLRHGVIGSVPFSDVSRLVVIENRGAYDIANRQIETPAVSWPDFEDLGAQQDPFEAVAGIGSEERTVWEPGGRARSVQRVVVTSRLFELLGVKATLGRLLTRADFAPEAPRVAVATTRLWRAQLGADPRAVGTVVHVDGEPVTLIGIVDEDVLGGLRERKAVFERADARECLIVPVPSGSGTPADRLMAFHRQNRGMPALTVFGRMRPGRTLDAVQRAAAMVAHRLAAQYPETNRGRTFEASALGQWRIRAVGRLRPILLAAAVLAWLAACASAAGLVLADAVRRQGENAVRHALGASRTQLARLALRRSLRWTLPGGAIGLGLAWLAVPWLSTGTLPGRATVDPLLLGSALGMTVLAGLVLGGIASWVLSRQDLASGLKELGPGTSLGPRHRLALTLVVALQVAAATSLGLVSALLLQSMAKIVAVDVGFDASNAFMIRVFFPNADAGARSEAQSAFVEGALERLRSLPTAVSAGFSVTPPLSHVVVTSGGDYRLEMPGAAPIALGPLVTEYVSPGYFAAAGMRFNRGRGFSADDARSGAPVLVVDEAFCRRHLGASDPLLAGIRVEGVLYRIVGVLRDVRPDGPVEDARATLYALRDKTQPPLSVGHFVVRSSAGSTRLLMEDSVKTLVSLDPRLVVDDPRTFDDLLGETLVGRRRTLRMLGIAAAIVFLLTAFSIGGALSEWVEHGTRDLALRKALGASSADMALLLARYVFRPCLAGLAAGALGGWWLARTLSGELFHVSPDSPAAMVVAVGCVLVVGLLAAVGPLARAISVSPARVLRGL